MDLLDFYRGTLSARRLRVLVEQLPTDCALNRAINGGEPPWTRLEHLTADVWALWAKQDHPKRAEMEAQARAAVKTAKVIYLRTKFEKRKAVYGLK